MSDSADPLFWEERYRAENRPWERHGVPKILSSLLESMKPEKPGRVLLPGCGSAYELKIFLDAGWDAWGIDFSETAVKRARGIVPEHQERLLLGDFFTYQFEHSFDLIYERSFLCALPPRLRAAYASRMNDLLLPRGKLVGFFLYGAPFEGPPFPLKDGKEAKELLSDFELIEDCVIEGSHSTALAKEHWQEWKKK